MSEVKIDPFFLRWDFIEKIADNEISKIVGIVPLVGYLILFNDSLLDTLSFSDFAGVSTEGDTPFFWSSITKLRSTFFGSILLLLANLSFRAASPRVLTHSKSDIQFSEKVTDSYSLMEIQSIERDVMSENWSLRSDEIWNEVSQRYKGVEEFRSRLNNLKLAGFQERKFVMGGEPEYVQLISREWWLGEMHSKKPIRILTVMLSTFGYSMLALPTIDIAQAVVRDLL